MAIIDNTQNNNTNAAKAEPQVQPQQSGKKPGDQFWSFHQKNVLNSPVSAGIGGEYFTKMRTLLGEIYKDIAEGLQVDIISLNRQNFPALKFSALIVACVRPEINKSVVAYHTLILEATGGKLDPEYRQVDGQNVQINHVTGDAYDQILAKTAFDVVQAEYRDASVYPADAMVVPSNVTVENKETVENIARNAALACVSVINAATNTGKGDLNLAYIDRDCRFVIDVAFGNHQVYDVVGQPQRSSVLINFSSQKKNLQNTNTFNTVNVPDSVARICELSGFMNTIWAPVEQAGFGFQGYNVNPNIPRPTQKFAAEFVMTSVRTDYATSLPAVLLSLSSFLSLVDNNAWFQAFLPNAKRVSNDKVDITDIGALNITANIGGETLQGGFGNIVDIPGMKGDLGAINKYIVSLFRPGVVISMDCPEAGPQSWYTSVFIAAAAGDRAAINMIYQAFQELTNNQFERYFKQDDTMFSNIVRVPLGYYMVGDQMQDIRNIDYVAIANIFKNNPAVIHEYSNTFVERPGVSQVRNLAIREGIIREALNQQCVITGYAARVSFSDTLVKAYSAALADCNLPVSVNTPLNADQMRLGTPTPGFVEQSLAGNTHTFSSGYAQARSQPYGYRGGFRNNF